MQCFRNAKVEFILMLFIAGAFAAGPKKAVKANTVFVKKDQGYRLGVVIKNSKEKSGAEIVTVFKNSEAEKIGLQKGDIIVSFNGKNIIDAGQLNKLVQDTEEGKKVEIAILRDGEKKNFKALMKTADDDSVKVMSFNVDDIIDNGDIEVIVSGIGEEDGEGLGKLLKIFSMKNSDFRHWNRSGDKGGYLGVDVDELTEQLHDYFKVKNGVLITEVIKDAPAEKAGLRAGDVIYKINEKKIDDYADLQRTLNYYDPGEKVTIYYSRKGKNAKKTVELAKKENALSYTYSYDVDAADNIKALNGKSTNKSSSVLIVNGQNKVGLTKDIDIELYII